MPGARDRSRLSLRYATSSDVPTSPWAAFHGREANGDVLNHRDDIARGARRTFVPPNTTILNAKQWNVLGSRSGGTETVAGSNACASVVYPV